MPLLQRVIITSPLIYHLQSRQIHRLTQLLPGPIKTLPASFSAFVKSATIRPVKSDLPGQLLPPYLVFRYSDAYAQQPKVRVVRSKNSFNLTNFGSDLEPAQISRKPLLLMFCWMLSEQPHIEKYRKFWTDRGFDILTVQTSPLALLMPGIGGSYVARDVFKFLTQIQPRYDEVLVHAFSVGGYALGEFLNVLISRIRRGDAEADRIYNAIKGIIMDSVVFSDDAPPGLSRAITRHPIGQPVLEASLATLFKVTKPYTMDRYKMLERHIVDNERRVPSMMLFSRDDIVSNWRTNFAVVTHWEDHGVTSRAKCWEKSSHVLHYKNHPKEYEKEVDDFVARLSIVKAPRRSTINQVHLRDYGTEPFTDYDGAIA